MDRIINVKVGGNHLSKDNKNAGVKGEANVTNLRITFDEGWDGYAKTVTFFDAYGNNPVKRIQGVDLIEDITKDARTYLTPIPREPMAVAGELTFVIDGYLDGKRQRSISDKLIVKDAPYTDDATEPTDPTPTQAEQIQSQIDSVMNTIQNAAISAAEAKTSEQNAQTSETNAMAEADLAKSARADAEGFAKEAKEHSTNAAGAANKAEIAITHNPIIVDGYWHVWSATDEKYIDTRVRAQAGSEVYCGDNPPTSADVWVNPSGEIYDFFTNEEIARLKELLGASSSYGYINLLGGDKNWTAENVTDNAGNVIGVRYGQRVNVNNAEITKQSKVDLQINSEQMVVFYEKDLAFVTENDGGVVTVYCVGNIPENDYKIKAVVTEVAING